MISDLQRESIESMSKNTPFSEKVGAGGRNILYYGSRKSGKLVRCYSKKNLGVYRVELEMHSSLLRAHHVSDINSLATLGSALLPDHLRFVRFDWRRLRRYLIRRFGRLSGLRMWKRVKRLSKSIHRAARYLRRRGVVNVHRFMKPLAINTDVRHSFSTWTTQFKKGNRT